MYYVIESSWKNFIVDMSARYRALYVRPYTSARIFGGRFGGIIISDNIIICFQGDFFGPSFVLDQPNYIKACDLYIRQP